MRIQVNGESRDIPARLSLQELTIHLKLPTDRVAIELNHGVVRRAEWPATTLQEGDRVEVVHFVGGGRGNLDAPQPKVSRTPFR